MISVSRRRVLQLAAAASLFPAVAVRAASLRDPVWVYDNWAAYDIGDPRSPRLTEALALRLLDEVVRYKRLGVRFDYYMMNAFWFEPKGSYRQWRKDAWPNGPDRWISRCREHGIKPGLWFGTNSLWEIEASSPQWRESLAVKRGYFPTLSLYEGGFLADFLEVLQHWYDRGVRMFELDTAEFDAATAAALQSQSPEEIRRRNVSALRKGLQTFRRRNPDAMLVAFNGFGGDISSTSAPFPFKNPVDLGWLEIFDTLYSGDTRVADVPQASFWRSVDLYNDHMVRRYEQSGVPLERIDPFFTLSATAFGYRRGKRAWKSALLLAAARGSWKQTIYGELSLLSDEDVRWFAKVQSMYIPLLSMGRTKSFGAIPGEGQPYGFCSFDSAGALYTLVNPSQEFQTVPIPSLSAARARMSSGRVLFRDAGFSPELSDAGIRLGPGQMAVVGFGRFAVQEHDLGVEPDVVIPRSIRPLDAKFETVGANTIEATFSAPAAGDLRVFFRHGPADGRPLRLKPLGRVEVRQGRREIAFVSYMRDASIGSAALAWTGVEVDSGALDRRRPITIRYSFGNEKPSTVGHGEYVVVDEPVQLSGRVYAVEYETTGS